MPSVKAISLAALPLLLAVKAEVKFDTDDIPKDCTAICKPIGELSDKCDVDLRSDNDRDEHRLEDQCFCTNKSFDVAKIAGLCASCIHQSKDNNKRDNDQHADQGNVRDIDQIMSSCGFSSTTYKTADTSAAQGVSVSVSTPTNINQLTTTIGAGGAAGASANSSGSVASNTGNMTTPVTKTTTATDSTGGVTTRTQTSTPSLTSNAAAGPTAGAMYLLGALVAGGMAI